MQQFLLPSTEGGSSQIINIPVSLLSQGQQPISFITANGQIFQLPSFNQNGEASSTNTNANQQGSVNASSSSTASTASTTTNASGQQQALVINSQGQIISLPVLQPQNQVQQGGQVNQSQTTNNNNNNNNQTNSIQTMNTNNLTSFNQNTSNNNSTGTQQQQTVSLSQINFASLNNNNGVQLQTINRTGAANNAQVVGNGGTPIKTLLEDDEIKSDNDGLDDNGPTIANIPAANMNSGMPQVTHHATTVDGVNLDEIREFAKAFKLRRLALGLTQTQVGQALSATKGPAYSQSAICRFEKLDITPKSAAKIKPVLEKWMQEAELKYADRLKTGNQQNFADLLGSDSTKKRKRRTSFTPQALEILNEAFEKNTHPSGNQGADMTMLANKLNYDREVIRVWFCNKRQALKNTIKKFKGNGGLDESGNAGSPGEDMSPNQSQSQLNTSSQQIQQQQLQQQVQQQLQQSPIQNNVQQVQSTVNVVSSISQSLANVVANNQSNNTHTTTNNNNSSPKTVITLAANVPTAAVTQPVTTTTAVVTTQQANNTPTTQNPAPSTTPPITLKIESTQPSQSTPEQSQQNQH